MRRSDAPVDLEELLHLMHDRPTGQMVRCSKARAMFAMRACRKSVMVGMPLTKGQMTSVCYQPFYIYMSLKIFFNARVYAGCTTYGDNGSTMELPSW